MTPASAPRCSTREGDAPAWAAAAAAPARAGRRRRAPRRRRRRRPREPCRASRPSTTVRRPCAQPGGQPGGGAADDGAVEPCGPPRTGPRRPAVPKCSGPAKRSASVGLVARVEQGLQLGPGDRVGVAGDPGLDLGRAGPAHSRLDHLGEQAADPLGGRGAGGQHLGVVELLAGHARRPGWSPARRPAPPCPRPARRSPPAPSTCRPGRRRARAACGSRRASRSAGRAAPRTRPPRGRVHLADRGAQPGGVEVDEVDEARADERRPGGEVEVVGDQHRLPDAAALRAPRPPRW